MTPNKSYLALFLILQRLQISGKIKFTFFQPIFASHLSRNTSALYKNQFFAREVDAGIEFVDLFDGKPLRKTGADEHLSRCGVHGANIGDIDHSGFVTEVFERGVCKIEMNAYEEHPSRHRRQRLRRYGK